MLYCDQILDLFQQLLAEGVAPDTLDLDQLTDTLTQSGIDLSQLTEQDLSSLLDLFHPAGETANAASTATESLADATASAARPPSLQFGSTVEFPDGTQIDNPHQDHLGYVYKTTGDWINGTDRHVIDESN